MQTGWDDTKREIQKYPDDLGKMMEWAVDEDKETQL